MIRRPTPEEYWKFPPDLFGKLFFRARDVFPTHVRRGTDFVAGIRRCLEFIDGQTKIHPLSIIPFVDQIIDQFTPTISQGNYPQIATLVEVKLRAIYQLYMTDMKDKFKKAVKDYDKLKVPHVQANEEALNRLRNHLKAVGWDGVSLATGGVAKALGATTANELRVSAGVYGISSIATTNDTNMVFLFYENVFDREQDAFISGVDLFLSVAPGIGQVRTLSNLCFNVMCSYKELMKHSINSTIIDARNRTIDVINRYLSDFVLQDIENPRESEYFGDRWLETVIREVNYERKFFSRGFDNASVDIFVRDKMALFLDLYNGVLSKKELFDKKLISFDELTDAVTAARREMRDSFKRYPWQ